MWTEENKAELNRYLNEPWNNPRRITRVRKYCILVNGKIWHTKSGKVFFRGETSAKSAFNRDIFYGLNGILQIIRRNGDLDIINSTDEALRVYNELFTSGIVKIVEIRDGNNTRNNR